jgi:tetratricopeptide (TPR) repeat protein
MNDEEYNNLLSQLEKFGEDGEFDKAIDFLKTYLENTDKKEQGVFHYLIAMTYIILSKSVEDEDDLSNEKEAIKYFDEVFTNFPELLDDDFLYEYARSKALLGDAKQSKELCKMALKFNDKRDDIYAFIGANYNALGDVENALKYTFDAIDLNDQNLDTYFSLGLICQSNNMFEEAIDAFKKVIELDEDNIDAYYQISDIYYYLENLILSSEYKIKDKVSC